MVYLPTAIAVLQISNKTILNNIIFVPVNLWYLCAERTELVTCLDALCTTQEFNFLFFTGLPLSSPLLPSLQRRWREDCVKEYRAVQSVSAQDTVFRTQLTKKAKLL